MLVVGAWFYLVHRDSASWYWLTLLVSIFASIKSNIEDKTTLLYCRILRQLQFLRWGVHGENHQHPRS